MNHFKAWNHHVRFPVVRELKRLLENADKGLKKNDLLNHPQMTFFVPFPWTMIATTLRRLSRLCSRISRSTPRPLALLETCIYNSFNFLHYIGSVTLPVEFQVFGATKQEMTLMQLKGNHLALAMLSLKILPAGMYSPEDARACAG